MRSIVISLILFVAIASVGFAQVSLTPNAHLAFNTWKYVDSAGNVLESTNRTGLGLGVAVDFGSGFAGTASYTYARGGNVDYPFFDDHTETTTNESTVLDVGIRYTAFGNDALAIGPMINYISTSAEYDEKGTSWSIKDRINGLGFGAFVEGKIDKVAWHGSYVYRSSMSLTTSESGGGEDTYTGKGNALNVGISVPVFNEHKLTASYSSDTQIENSNGDKITTSGYKIGVQFAF